MIWLGGITRRAKTATMLLTAGGDGERTRKDIVTDYYRLQKENSAKRLFEAAYFTSHCSC